MIPWLRNGIVIFAILSVVYAVLALKARRRERDRLNAEYASSDKSVAKADFVATRLESYNRSAKPKLLLGVYGVPLLIAGILTYFAWH